MPGLDDLTAPILGQIPSWDNTQKIWVPTTPEPRHGGDETVLPGLGGYMRPNEAWKVVGSGGNAAFTAGWQHHADIATGWGHQVAYRRRADGFNEIRGYAQRVSGVSNTIFTLPVGYRPPLQMHWPIVCSGGRARLYITSGGLVGVEAIPGLAGTYTHPWIYSIAFIGY